MSSLEKRFALIKKERKSLYPADFGRELKRLRWIAGLQNIARILKTLA